MKNQVVEESVVASVRGEERGCEFGGGGAGWGAA